MTMRYRVATGLIMILAGSVPAQAQDDADVAEVSVTGAGFQKYHAVAVSTFRRLGRTNDERLRKLERAAPYARNYFYPFQVGVAYYFLPRCQGRRPRWDGPTAYIIGRRRVRIMLQCPA